METTIIINEQHNLMVDQIAALTAKGINEYKTILVPASGWKKKEMDIVLDTLKGDIVFVSPIPYMISRVASDAALNWASSQSGICHGQNPHISRCLVMCNDKREKKELPNGKVINVVAKTGWYLA